MLYYNITVTARDQAGNSGVKTKRVLLDNWEQKITTVVQPRQGEDPPNFYRFKVSGSNWTANSTVPLHVVHAQLGGLTSGTKIADIQVLRAADLVPDANGVIPETDVSFSIPVDAPPPPWYFIADYQGAARFSGG